MSSAIWIAAVAVVLGVALWRVLAPSLDRAVARAVKDQDVTALVEAILKMSPGAQPDAFNHSIRRMWDDYQRPLTIPLIKALVEHHGGEAIAQYWIQQVQGVEPELARQAFEPGFLEAHYQPQVAATCGDAGG